MKKISIIIPFKNTPLKWFKKLIESLNKQTNKNFEAIFIDDHSNDASKYIELINKYNYKYVLNDNKNYKGVGRVRDYGVTLAQHDLIWFIDSDDWITQDAINYLLNKFDQYPDIDFVMFDYYWVFNLKKSLKLRVDKQFKEYITDNNVYKNNMNWFHNNYQTDWRVCFRKQFIIENKITHRLNDSLFEDVYYGLIWKVLFNKALLSTKKIYFYNRLNVRSTLNNYKFKPEYLLKTILENKQYQIENKIFKDIWYFYALNWVHAVAQMKKKNQFNFKIKDIKKEFFNDYKYSKAKYIGINKYWFLTRFSKLRK